MAKLPWILVAGVMTVASAPIGCFVVGGDDGDHHGDSQATGTASGYGTSSSSGSVAPVDSCNPVTAAGCPSDGSTCDLSGNSKTFACFPPPNSVDVCGSCDVQNGPFCGAGLTCVAGGGSTAGVCYRYCCTDSDCGDGASCNTTFGATAVQPAIASDVIGLCVQGTGNGSEAPACGTASPVSGGSCVGGYAPSQGDAGTSSGSSGSSGSGSSSSGAGGSPVGDGGTSNDGGSEAATSSSSSGGDGTGGSPSSSSGGTGGFSAHPPPPPDGGHAGRGDAGAP